MNIKHINENEDRYPKLLKEITEKPSPLFYAGRLPQSDELCIGIVGTRTASDYGKKMSHKIAKDLANLGITVVSGLALGVDTAAHTGTLKAKGHTISVLAHGLDTIYPHENTSLAHRILETGGCLISEYPEGTGIKKEHFLERNRLISGLSMAIVVIEAPARSGALNTTRYAIEQNRDVFVIPGSIDSNQYTGSHRLIRQGATLIRNAEDIVADLGLDV